MARKLRIPLSLVALLLGFTASAQYPFDYQQFPPVQHDVPYYRQDTMVWCWVAVAKMIADYYGADSPEQCEILERQYGAPCCSNPNVCMRAGHMAEVAQLIRNFGGRSSSFSAPANGFALYAALERGPIVLNTSQGNGHFVIATGMRVVPTQYGPLGIVAINDPFYGQYEVEFPRLAAVWRAALILE